MIENNNNFDLSNNGILNNPHQNSFKEVSVIQSKESTIKSVKASGKNFIIYISIISSIYLLFFINYLKTNNWYEENQHYINLKPITLCSEYITNLESCLNETQRGAANIKKEGDYYVYDTKVICKDDNDKLQSCFDKVHSFSQRCQIYLNDLYLCKNKTGNKIENCINNNIYNCWRAYSIINISKVYDEL